MARPKRSSQEKQAELDKWRDDNLMNSLEASMRRIESISEKSFRMFNSSIHPDMIIKLGQLAVTTAEQHRKIALTIQNIRHPKSTVFIKSQVNQLAIETEQLKRQLESSKNATLDTGSQRETETVDIEAQILA
jgi:predicted lipoprotein